MEKLTISRHNICIQNSEIGAPNLADLRPSRTSWRISLALLLVVGMILSIGASAQMTMDVDHEMDAAAAQKLAKDPAYKIISCGMNGEQSLPAGDYDSDLHVVGPCVADGTRGHSPGTAAASGGTYKYHWVFIHKGGTLTFNDAKLDLYASSILVLNGGTLKAGAPSDTGAIGANGGVVTIHLWGANDHPAINCQDENGNQDVMCGIDKTIWNSNKMDMSKMYPTAPCTPNPDDPRNDCFYQYDDPGISVFYFGRKTLAVSYGGTLQLFGKKGSNFDGLTPDPKDTGKSWRRLATTLKATDMEFDVDGTVDWQGDDHIVITSTDYLPGHAEEAIISSVTPNGNNTTIKIKSIVLDDGTVQDGGVQYPHFGQTYKIPVAIKDKLKLDRAEVETRAAVALLSRSIRVVSEGDSGPDTSQLGVDPFPPAAGNYFGGHVIFRQAFKQVQVQGVEFRQLGQGGLIGRYAVHFHMARKVPLDTFVKDNSMNESMTRWITVHGSQGVLLARNVGWKSIGHGFYIEDGSETDNRIYANIGILARAGVANTQNPRQVPGILAHPDIADNRDPYNSDWQHPSVFWIMNGWNDFQYNMAAGAGSCGVCYWLPAGANSGPSRLEYWTGYASRQRGLQDQLGQREFNSGTSPLQNFVGNACSSAMFSFMEIGQLSSGCEGFGPTSGSTVAAIPGLGPDIPTAPPFGPNVYSYYPIVTGLRDPTKCNDLNQDCGSNTNPSNAKCNGTNDIDEKNCMATVLDHYTTSFNFAQKNFSAIWLRPWWKLVTDSAITDQLGPGLTFVTGGGYTRSDNSVGNWDVGLRNVLVGQTQPDPAGEKTTFFASDLGPFTPNGIPQCDNGVKPGGYCLSKNNGISIPITPFNAGQRMFNIYDGPSFQDSSAYLDIKARTIGDCIPGDRDSVSGVCDASKYMYGHSVGLLKSPDGKSCYIPNAAIAWKQENGFYYPPAFHSRNLAFSGVDIRHFVIEPLFLQNSFTFDEKATSARYCTWTSDLFRPFNDIDRQTVLNDNDGSLTGLLADSRPGPRETLSVNLDTFFRAPKVVPECASDKHYGTDQKLKPATAVTSPYEYVTSAIIADCGLRSVTDETNRECGVGEGGLRNWTWDCTHCYGVPLFRQNWTAQDNADCENDPSCPMDPLHRPGRITMMGQSTGQRSTLTASHGWYYIDTTVPAEKQIGMEGRTVFLSGHTYYVYLVYGMPSTEMEYWMYVGAGADEKKVLADVGRYRVNINSQVYGFNPKPASDPDFLTDLSYDPVSGWLKVGLNLQRYTAEFDRDKKNFCKPVSYCSWNGISCGCNKGNPACKDDSVCGWGPQDTDCPSNGCFGFSFKIEPEFDMGTKPGPPPPTAFPSDSYWNVAYKLVDEGISGPECHYGQQPR